jgi:hypothetical protein
MFSLICRIWFLKGHKGEEELFGRRTGARWSGVGIRKGDRE